MTRSFQLGLALLAWALAPAVHAQEAPAPDSYKGVTPQVRIRAIKVKGRVNPGDLPYGWVIEDQQRLQSYLPAQDRMVDFTWRITFTELNLSAQDNWVPRSWAVAVVGDNGYEQDVPVARGGYFLLPVLPQGRRGATVMFHEQSLPGHIAAAWRVHVGADGRLPYAGFRQAMDEIRGAQNEIPLLHEGLRRVRESKYDALKACFLAPGGQVLVDGVAIPDAGNCTILKYDPALAAAGRTVEFKGPLDVVTVVESKDYETYLDPAALALLDATGSAPTDLPNVDYRWNLRRQQQLQSVLPAGSRLVNFVWRMSLDGLSEAEQDAWTPQGWALALSGKDYASAVPVARGGYFLLPALPPGQDATLMFKEHGKRSLVGAAWAVRPRAGERPFLYYGEINDAMKAVRRAQDTIPDRYEELVALRAAHYDGLKACFLEDDGVVFVGDYPTADATVGNCRILKFNPAENVNTKVQFIGNVDAVTVVDTASYLKAKG
jgi:uncharacterized protein YciI